MDAIAQQLLTECIDFATTEAVLNPKRGELEWFELRKQQVARLQALQLRLESAHIEVIA